MLHNWNTLSDEFQLALSDAALLKAAETIAHQAELLADEIEAGSLNDRGGPDALRLLAAFVRVAGQERPSGHA